GFGLQPDRPLVLLLQEAFRAGEAVPAEPHDASHGGHRIVPGRTDVVAVAREAGLSLRYAPSMRNGHHRSDRGNAILANVALEDTHSFLLPHVRQRRVAVTTHLSGVADVVLATAHLDTGGGPRLASPRRDARNLLRFGAGRLVQADELVHRLIDPEHGACVVLGADLNTALGVRDPVVRALVTAGFHPATRVGGWRHTYHARVRLLLDHVLYRSPTGRIARVRVARIDEAMGDRSARVFGSDHHPLFARIDFNDRANDRHPGG
ncbi:MAG: endonuclease/exonuclease/phosphatase family protein, partial [Longimicrobiales bacterium]